MAEDEYADWTCHGECNKDRTFAIPYGVGAIQVTGADDPAPPPLVNVVWSPDQIDTLPSDQTVGIDVHATDADADGIDNVRVFISSATASGGDPFWATDPATAPVTGTRHDGIWHFDVTIPQGTPPGTYYLDIAVTDTSHVNSYVPPGSPYADQPSDTVMTPDQGAGTLTVVQHTP